MQTVTPTTPLWTDEDVDALFDAPISDLKPTLTLPQRQQRESVRMIGSSPLASQVRDLVLESSPAGWWWQIEALGTGGVRVVACPSESATDFSWLSVGTINVQRDGSIASTYGAPKARTGQLTRASTAVSTRVTHEEAPEALLEVSTALQSAIGSRRAA